MYGATVRKRHGPDDLGPDHWMRPHAVELVRRQAAGLRQDVLRHCQFADVVE
jgi:hypothetical protein